MTDKELKKLSRKELLEMLVIQTRRTEALEKEIEDLKAKLKRKEIVVEKTGNLAEAALKLNYVFEAAQRAADQYLYNVRSRAEESDPDE